MGQNPFAPPVFDFLSFSLPPIWWPSWRANEGFCPALVTLLLWMESLIFPQTLEDGEEEAAFYAIIQVPLVDILKIHSQAVTVPGH